MMLPVLATDSVSEDLARAVGYALLWGLEGVAVRSVGGERVPFVNEAAMKRRLDESEMPLATIDPGLFEGDASRRAVWLNDVVVFDETALFCRRLGCGVVRIGALAEAPAAESPVADGLDAVALIRVAALQALGNVAQRHGLRLAVRNDASTLVATGAHLAALLASVNHPAVGADWRPIEAAHAGEDPVEGLEALLAAAPVFCVAVADEQAADDGARVDAVVGAGEMRWEEQIQRLAAAGYDGPLALEVHGRPAAPAGLASATALVHAVRTAVRAARQASLTP